MKKSVNITPSSGQRTNSIINNILIETDRNNNNNIKQ